MDIEFTLKNYRCFSDQQPARIRLREGLTSFVGVNNAGKSSLLRFFYEFRSLFDAIQTYSATLPAALKGQGPSITFPQEIVDTAELFCNANQRPLEIGIRAMEEGADGDSLDVPTIRECSLIIQRDNRGWQCKVDAGIPTDTTSNLYVSSEGRLCKDNKPLLDLSALIQVGQVVKSMLYLPAFRNAINAGAMNSYFDIAVGQGFIQQWRGWQAGNVKKSNEAVYKVIQDIQRLFQLSSLQAMPSADEKTLQLMVEGKSYKLHEMGAGIAQFFLVLAHAAMREPSFILIDEPELSLHPSLQIEFLETLAGYARYGVLFATHSIGLARARSDYSYSVRKVGPGQSAVVDYEETPDLATFLRELSYSGYRELGFSKVLLVEGSSEVKTVRQFLRKYRHDHQVVSISLGGADVIKASSAVELEEFKRICGSVSALIDSERESGEAPLSEDRAAFVETCEALGITSHVLQRRALENYLTDQAIKQVKGEKYQELGPYQKLKAVEPHWAKSENWKIAQEMSLEDIENTDLGVFLRMLCSAS